MSTKSLDKCNVMEVPYSKLDSSVAMNFKKNLLKLFLSSKNQDLILDLKNVDYIDAAGLESLIFAGALVQENKGKLSICSVNRFVKQILMRSRLYKFFDINRSVNDSLEYINDPELTDMCNYRLLKSKLKSHIK